MYVRDGKAMRSTIRTTDQAPRAGSLRHYGGSRSALMRAVRAVACMERSGMREPPRQASPYSAALHTGYACCGELTKLIRENVLGGSDYSMLIDKHRHN